MKMEDTISARECSLGALPRRFPILREHCKRRSIIQRSGVISEFTKLHAGFRDEQRLVMAHIPRLPAEVPLDLGALLEPLGVAIHASRRAALKSGSTVLIFGAGAVGLLCAAMATVNGAGKVIIADILPDRVDFAVKNKFAHAGFVVPLSSGGSQTTTKEKLDYAVKVAEIAKGIQIENGPAVGEVDAVFECTGVESCLQAAVYVSLQQET